MMNDVEREKNKISSSQDRKLTVRSVWKNLMCVVSRHYDAMSYMTTKSIGESWHLENSQF